MTARPQLASPSPHHIYLVKRNSSALSNMSVRRTPVHSFRESGSRSSALLPGVGTTRGYTASASSTTTTARESSLRSTARCSPGKPTLLMRPHDSIMGLAIGLCCVFTTKQKEKRVARSSCARILAVVFTQPLFLRKLPKTAKAWQQNIQGHSGLQIRMTNGAVKTSSLSNDGLCCRYDIH